MSNENEIKIAYLTQVLGLDEDEAEQTVDNVALFEGDADQYAREYVDDVGLSDQMLESYFDYEAFGRDIRLGGDLEYYPELENSPDHEIGVSIVHDILGSVDEVHRKEFYVDYPKLARDMVLGGDIDEFEYDGVTYVIANAHDQYMPRRNPRHHGSTDEMAQHDLYLHITSDANLYRQVIVPNLQAIQKKIDKGLFSRELAMRSFKRIADLGAKSYTFEYDRTRGARGAYDVKGYGIFSSADRHAVAEMLADHYLSDMGDWLRKNPVQCTDGRYSYATPEKDEETGEWNVSGICTSKIDKTRRVAFDDDGKPKMISKAKMLEIVRKSDHITDAVIPYIHTSFPTKSNVKDIAKTFGAKGYNVHNFPVQRHAGGMYFTKKRTEEEQLKKNPTHNRGMFSGSYDKVRSRYRINSVYAGQFMSSSAVFKSVEQVTRAIENIQSAYHYGQQGQEYVYEIGRRYGYSAIDYMTPEQARSGKGGIQGTIMTNLTREGANELKIMLTDANQNGLAERR